MCFGAKVRGLLHHTLHFTCRLLKFVGTDDLEKFPPYNRLTGNYELCIAPIGGSLCQQPATVSATAFTRLGGRIDSSQNRTANAGRKKYLK